MRSLYKISANIFSYKKLVFDQLLKNKNHLLGSNVFLNNRKNFLFNYIFNWELHLIRDLHFLIACKKWDKLKLPSISDNFFTSSLSNRHSLISPLKTYKNKNKKLSKLTKKQLKRIKFKKLSKLIWPGSPIFSTNIKVKRSLNILHFHTKSEFILIHDGYSWQKAIVDKEAYNKKFGTLIFQTRVLSPINFFDKGSKSLEMKQKLTYKIKGVKIKRKK